MCLLANSGVHGQQSYHHIWLMTFSKRMNKAQAHFVVAVILIGTLCCDDRKYQKSVEQLQSTMDKMRAKSLTVEQYLSSVLSTVCISAVLFCISVLK